MKSVTLVLLVAVCCVQCRKIVPQINKNANIDFINMEAGGVSRPPVQPPKPAAGAPTPTTKAPVVSVAQPPLSPVAKPAVLPSPTPAPISKPVPPQPSKPAQPAQGPVQPAPGAAPVTTPGPGSVKSLINYYDSRGNASPIRPYSYSQAVKQG